MFEFKNWEEYTYYLFIYLKDGLNEKFRSDFFQLHRNHQLRYFEMLNHSNRKLFYETINPSEFAPVFSKLEITNQQLIIKELEEIYALTTIDSLRTDEIIRFLNGLELERINYYLELLENHDVSQLRMLLRYDINTAGSIMTTEFITATEDETVAVVLDRLSLVGKDAETIYYIYIVKDSNQLVGVVSLRDLITSSREHMLKFIMKENVISIRISDHLVKVIKIIKGYDLLLVPVITKSNEMIGIITIDDVMNKKIENGFKKMPQTSIKIRIGILTGFLLGIVFVLLMTSLQF